MRPAVAAGRAPAPGAVEFVAALERRFGTRRMDLLSAREQHQDALNRGQRPTFLPHTQEIRRKGWTVREAPAGLRDRRVEITGPVERKMMINALNSGAKVFMADFEDALAPTWANVLDGQANLRDAVRRELTLRTSEGKEYRLNDTIATLVVRPRGWHLPESHVTVDGKAVSASLFDVGCYLHENVDELRSRGSGPYFYLPKLENHLEARLWADVFQFCEENFGLARGTIRATVLIETILAAFEMDEILWELRENISGLNAGRWDYIFSIIKKFQNDANLVLPDRAQVTMNVPFMRAYARLLVDTCHKRNAHAIGGMAAFVPSRKDPQVNETAFARVREDKEREAGDGFDGTWVAHPDLVPVAREVFDRVLGAEPHQLAKRNPLGERVQPGDLLNFAVPDGRVTSEGVRTNVEVGILYVESWLRGTGAAAIHNLMEDAATAEISRSQIWQWVHRGAKTAEGPSVDGAHVRLVTEEELQRIRKAIGEEAYRAGRYEEARRLFEATALSPSFVNFLTIPAYRELDNPPMERTVE
ncbi:MAG: malate synthase A [Thermoplasmatota archaeon]